MDVSAPSDDLDAARQAAAQAYQAAALAEQNIQAASVAQAATAGVPAPKTPIGLEAAAPMEPELPAGHRKRTNRHDRALKEGAKRLQTVQAGQTS